MVGWGFWGQSLPCPGLLCYRPAQPALACPAAARPGLLVGRQGDMKKITLRLRKSFSDGGRGVSGPQVEEVLGSVLRRAAAERERSCGLRDLLSQYVFHLVAIFRMKKTKTHLIERLQVIFFPKAAG